MFSGARSLLKIRADRATSPPPIRTLEDTCIQPDGIPHLDFDAPAIVNRLLQLLTALIFDVEPRACFRHQVAGAESEVAEEKQAFWTGNTGSRARSGHLVVEVHERLIGSKHGDLVLIFHG